MTYQSYETSTQNGEVTSLYEIVWGGTKWRYTSADRPLTLGGELIDGVFTPIVYQPVACSDNGMKQGGSSNEDIEIMMPSNIPINDLYRSTPPANTIRITVRRRHNTDPDGQAFVYWKGYLSNVKRGEGNASITLVCNTLLSSFTRQGLRLGWTRGCPHILYDNECRVNPADFVHETTIAALDGNSITMADDGGKEEGWFTGGYIEWEVGNPETLDRRGISASLSTTQLVLLGTTYRLAVDTPIRVYPGCDLTMATCRNKFVNRENYGGCKQMSGDNPFGGKAII